jgi:hypothetical protein
VFSYGTLNARGKKCHKNAGAIKTFQWQKRVNSPATKVAISASSKILTRLLMGYDLG